MKTRLLKKLRKKASKKFALKRTVGGFTVYDAQNNSYWYSTASIEEAKERCKIRMNTWISNEVRMLRIKYPREIIHYYPW